MVIENKKGEKIQGVEDKNLEMFQLEMLFNTDINVWRLYNKLQNCKKIFLNNKIVLCICKNDSSLNRIFNEYRCRCYDNDYNFAVEEPEMNIFVFWDGQKAINEEYAFRTIDELKEIDNLVFTDIKFCE